MINPDPRGDGAAPGQRLYEGVLPGGGRYVIDVPANWNGMLLIFSVGYIIGPPGQPPHNAPDEVIRAWLLHHGYALAGSQPVGVGWAVEEIMPDQVATLDVFSTLVGAPRHTIAWGTSMGGLITAGLAERYPERFAGAVPLCGSVAGGLGMLNQALDAVFALQTLLAPDIRLVRFTSRDDEQANTARIRDILAEAQQTAQGRARIALAAAFAQLSTWSVVGSAEPGASDWAAQQQQQSDAYLFAVAAPRQPLEARAGGNFSWNTGGLSSPAGALGPRQAGQGALPRCRPRPAGRPRRAAGGATHRGGSAGCGLYAPQHHAHRRHQRSCADAARDRR